MEKRIEIKVEDIALYEQKEFSCIIEMKNGNEYRTNTTKEKIERAIRNKDKYISVGLVGKFKLGNDGVIVYAKNRKKWR